MAQNRWNASVNFASSASDERWHLQFKELERIQNKLEEFLRSEQARETADQIYDRVLEVDEELDRILADPLVRRSYEYDGQFFTPKYSWGFHRAFDGLHILKSLTDDFMETFFRGSEKEFALRWLMEELGKDIWLAKRRRMNWEESKTLGLIPKPVLDEIAKQIRQYSGTAVEHTPLSPEEESFFRPFEQQLQSCSD